jgi:lipopolysaccharide transport system ATP-binding protein
MSSEVAIALHGVGKAYRLYEKPQHRLWQGLWRGRRRFYRELWALRDVSAEVRVGEAFGIVGPNGAGKSTLLQIVAGTLAPTQGRLEVRRRVSAVLELGSGFDARFSGRQNVYLNAAILGLSRAEVDARFDEILDFAGIGDFIDRPLATYSSGMQARLAFSVAICVDPQILLVDEALAVGDVGFQHKCVARLAELRERGATLLLVSHDMMLLRNQCDRLLYLREGRVQEIGAPEAVGERYLRDTFAERQRGSDFEVADRSPLEPTGGRDGIRFGSGGGEILEVRLESGGREVDAVRPGEALRLRVAARVAPALRSPEVLFQIRDQRGYVVYGASSAALGVKLAPTASGSVAVEFELCCRLYPEDYSLVVSLVDRVGEGRAILADKIVGARRFHVLASGPPGFHGVVDLGASCRALEPGEA